MSSNPYYITSNENNRSEESTELRGSMEVCLRLNLVPLVLTIHTSNPLSARMNGRFLSAEFKSQMAPSCTHIQKIQTPHITKDNNKQGARDVGLCAYGIMPETVHGFLDGFSFF